MTNRRVHPERDKRQGSVRTPGGRTSRAKGPPRTSERESAEPGEPDAVLGSRARTRQVATPAAKRGTSLAASTKKKAAGRRQDLKLEGRPNPRASQLIGKGKPPARGRPKVGPKK